MKNIKYFILASSISTMFSQAMDPKYQPLKFNQNTQSYESPEQPPVNTIPLLSPERNESEMVDFYHYSQPKDVHDIAASLRTDENKKEHWPAVLIVCEDTEQSYAAPTVIAKTLNKPPLYLASKEVPKTDPKKYNAILVRSLAALLVYYNSQQTETDSQKNANNFVDHLRTIKKEKTTGLLCGITTQQYEALAEPIKTYFKQVQKSYSTTISIPAMDAETKDKWKTIYTLTKPYPNFYIYREDQYNFDGYYARDFLYDRLSPYHVAFIPEIFQKLKVHKLPLFGNRHYFKDDEVKEILKEIDNNPKYKELIKQVQSPEKSDTQQIQRKLTTSIECVICKEEPDTVNFIIYPCCSTVTSLKGACIKHFKPDLLFHQENGILQQGANKTPCHYCNASLTLKLGLLYTLEDTAQKQT